MATSVDILELASAGTLDDEARRWTITCSQEDYFRLPDRGFEFVDGVLEPLALPSVRHQRILTKLLLLLGQFVEAHQLGEVLCAGLRLRTRPGHYREPDIVFLSAGRSQLSTEQFWAGADLVVEIVSPDEPKRDYVTKRAEYAAAEVREYWIIDPQRDVITILHLDGGAYRQAAELQAGDTLTSIAVVGFVTAVERVLYPS